MILRQSSITIRKNFPERLMFSGRFLFGNSNRHRDLRHVGRLGSLMMSISVIRASA